MEPEEQAEPLDAHSCGCRSLTNLMLGFLENRYLNFQDDDHLSEDRSTQALEFFASVQTKNRPEVGAVIAYWRFCFLHH